MNGISMELELDFSRFELKPKNARRNETKPSIPGDQEAWWRFKGTNTSN
jgi:hypothetical protein